MGDDMQGIVSYFENKEGYDFYFLYTIMNEL